METVTANKFAVAMGELLDEYSLEVHEAVERATVEVADKAVKDLKAVQRGKTTGNAWKKFPRSWTKTVEKSRYGSVKATVHLKSPHHRIGHLLEFDHASRGGGRSVSGNDFIRPVADDVEKDYEEKLTRKIGDI